MPIPSMPPKSDVTDLLQNQPSPKQTVEVDAYFSGATSVGCRRGGPRLINKPKEVLCPLFPWNAALTDRPFQGMLSVLNSIRNNPLPDSPTWLIATTPEALTPGVRVQPKLPYYARFRGRLGDPAFAKCPNGDRIFIVEQVVKVYEQQAPNPNAFIIKLPEDYDNWHRYRNTKLGYSIPYPPDWKVEVLSEPNVLSALALRSPQLPNHPVIVRVHPYETLYDQWIDSSSPLLKETTSSGVFGQNFVSFGQGKGSQNLSGFIVERDGKQGELVKSVLFSTRQHTYELLLRYPTGFNASQPLLTYYSAIVFGFQLDNPAENIPHPQPTPTEPPRDPS
jgi:hypothetical protein